MKTLLLILGLFVTPLVYAAVVPVQVRENTGTKGIQATSENIVPNTEIDITLPFTANEKAVVKTAFGFTDKEAEVMNKVTEGEPIDPNDIGVYVSATQKMAGKRELSPQEHAYLWTSGKSAKEVGAYLQRKEILEI